MHSNAPKCTGMHLNTPKCTQLHPNAPECTKMHHNAPECTRMHHNAPSLTDQLRDLGLERLDTRRVAICRRFAHTTSTKSRHKDIFSVAAASNPRPGKASRQFREPLARTAMYRKSAVPYLTRLLNS